MIDFFVKF